jgi:hypothetical protein
MFSFLGFPGITTQSKPEEKPTATNTASASSAQILNSSSGQEVAPSFPAQNSIQRAASSSQRTKPTTPASPSSHPTFTFQSPDDDEEDGYNEDEEEANLVMEELNNVDLDTLLELPHSTMQKPKKPRKKVHLLPGFSQLDWARLKASGAKLRVRLFLLHVLIYITNPSKKKKKISNLSCILLGRIHHEHSQDHESGTGSA